MTQEEKDLVLKDLCARLPYGIKVNNEIQGDFKIYGICENFVFGRNEVCHIDFDIEKIKPYLFPLSSMTDDATGEFVTTLEWIKTKGHSTSVMTYDSFDCLNKHHIDYRGLIPMGLAIDATGLGIYE